MEKRPLIGLTPYKRDPADPNIANHYHQNESYANILHGVGATAVYLPYDFDDWDILDGVLFCGGGDIMPNRGAYDEEDGGEAQNLCDARDEFETRLFHAANEREMPILGICRGCQLINYIYGGKIVKDMAAFGYEENHRCAPFGVKLHTVIPVEGTLVEKLLGGPREAASFHHQSVKTPGKGLVVSATSPEGVIEAIEHENGRILGLQFHPERLGWTEPFEWFVNLAKEYREKREQ